MFRRIIGSIVILTVLAATALFTEHRSEPVEMRLDTPSPALGKVIANEVHQTLSDPYLLPLEKLVQTLGRFPGTSDISVDMLTRWCSDDELPTCFVWNTTGNRFQIDRSTDRELIDQIIEHLQEGLNRGNTRQLLSINTIRYKGEKFWLSYLGLPIGAPAPVQIAGAFFSVDRYLESDAPRLLNEMINRPRFPLVDFQADSRFLGEVDNSHLSLRIVKGNGDVYFQRGRTFDKEKLIYAESQYFRTPVVALMEGWDLQVFSANANPALVTDSPLKRRLFFGGAALIISLIWWMGTAALSRPRRVNPNIATPAPRPNRGIRLDKSQKDDEN